MLKSTYKPAAVSQPLPAGWTEHKAPTASNRSTYTRPVSDLQESNNQPHPATQHNSLALLSNIPQHGAQFSQHIGHGLLFRDLHPVATENSRGYDGRQRPQPKDRPKTKHAIPGCEPWVLVKTKLGRRFVHNPEQNESFWKFPPDVMKAVVEYDRSEREKKVQSDRGSVAGEKEEEPPKNAEERTDVLKAPLPLAVQERQDKPPDESDEYEEVEVTDEEDEQGTSKRQKTGEEEAEQPVEFNEDDIAYQLAAMGQDYGLDPGEYGSIEGQDLEEGAEGLPLSEEDASALFKDMLDDHHINPYNPWEKLIDEGRIIEDDRYTVLPNMKVRKEIWSEWSRERIQRLKEQREQEEKKDPRIPYFAFLQAKGTPKLYWPEFRRKYMKEPVMRNSKVADKEREKWYREYINRLKLPESTLKTDLVSLLKSMPLHALNRSTSMTALPPVMLADIRYVSLRPSVRDPLIETHISTLPEPPEGTDLNTEGERVTAKRKQERQRREALAERQMQVQREKRRAREALEYSKGMMREGEQEVQRAMKVGKRGLLDYMEKDERSTRPLEGEN
ncbi:MAG: hypothetical protein LQ343_003357 [Gyalolechia ehrenbergii]|nr:MAG: hypothetical protein LQ343_003357 [Gyalolechia ehrenbergii]